MSDYLFLVNVGDEITSSVHLSKFIVNRMSQSKVDITYKVGVYTQNFNNISWKKIDEIEFNNNNNIVLNSNDYNLSVGQLAVVVPVGVDMNLENEYLTLPQPLNRKVDLSLVSKGASVSFSRGGAFSGYQGDYSYQASRVKGTFLAFDPLVKSVNKNIRTKLVFINIHSDKLTEKQSFTLNEANVNTKEKITSTEYFYNSAGILDVKLVNNAELCFYSKDTLGVPIFISYDDADYLSVEHTHPPSSCFHVNGIKGQKILKKNWLSQLL